MRLDRLLPLAVAALLAACNPQSAERGGTARTPLPAVQAPAAQTAAPACDCPKDETAKAGASSRKEVARKAWHRAGVRKVVAHAERRTYRRHEALAGGPPAPRSEYARVPREYYEDEAATSYRYGPAYAPPPSVYRDRDEDWRREYRYERGDAGRHHRHEDRYGDRFGDRYDEERRAERDAPPPLPPRVDRDDRDGPPPHQTKRTDRGSSYESGSSYSERYSYRDADERRAAPPPPPRGYGYQERRSYEGRYEERSESSSSFEQRSQRREGPCCRAEAAGFDANGFLTWPGKVPARP